MKYVLVAHWKENNNIRHYFHEVDNLNDLSIGWNFLLKEKELYFAAKYEVNYDGNFYHYGTPIEAVYREEYFNADSLNKVKSEIEI